MVDPQVRSDAIDTTVAHPARRYNYWLGGKDNFAADRESGDEFLRHFPWIPVGVRANRAFLQRVVQYLTAEAGIRQFLDIGTGLPTADNTHEVAQRIAPDSRIVYVDNDPLVLVHARALLNGTAAGRTAYVQADLREPDVILAQDELSATLDLTRPVALMIIAVFHFVPGEGVARPIVRRLMEAMPSGSYLAVTHVTQDFMPPEQLAAHEKMASAGRSDYWLRGRDEFGALFDGLELVEPGIVPVSQWRPEPGAPVPDPSDVGVWGAVARKP
jgi:O-methyltransferase involved in polyketide biosynthesis